MRTDKREYLHLKLISSQSVHSVIMKKTYPFHPPNQETACTHLSSIYIFEKRGIQDSYNTWTCCSVQGREFFFSILNSGDQYLHSFQVCVIKESPPPPKKKKNKPKKQKNSTQPISTSKRNTYENYIDIHPCKT